MIFAFLIVFLFMAALAPVQSFAAWTPLIATTDFDGIRTDVIATSGGILSLLLIILGIGILIRVLGR